MEYSQGFKARMVQRMTGPESISAWSLGQEIGVAQSTLSRWKRRAATIVDMDKDPETDKTRVPPDKRSAEEKFRIVMESARLSDEDLGAFLRREGVHERHLETWHKEMMVALNGSTAPARRSRKGTPSDAKRIKSLERQLRRKDKALAETAALLVLQKKVQDLWGDGDDGTGGSSGA